MRAQSGGRTALIALLAPLLLAAGGLVSKGFDHGYIFDWYGDDFISNHESVATEARDVKDRAILGVVSTYGPATAEQLARSGRARLDFLDYNWTLNDIAR